MRCLVNVPLKIIARGNDSALSCGMSIVPPCLYFMFANFKSSKTLRTIYFDVILFRCLIVWKPFPIDEFLDRRLTSSIVDDVV